MKRWEGTITVQVTSEFQFDIGPEWKARGPEHAREMVEMELTDYLGEAFVEERFDEHWDIVEEKT